MKTTFKQLLLLFIIIMMSNSSLCPKKPQKYTKTISLSKQDTKYKSQELDAFYSIKNNNQVYKLVGYRIQNLNDGQSDSFNIVDFEMNAQKTWQIVSVSKKGNCVGVLVDNDVYIAFDTGSKTFKQIQNIKTKQYSQKKFQTTDDCTTIHLKYTKDGAQTLKIYKNSQQITQNLNTPTSIFDKTFKYGINNIGQLLILQKDTYTKAISNSAFIKSNIISIVFNQKFNTVITVTKDNQDTYSLFIVNLLNLTNFYNKIFKKSDYKTDLKFEIREQQRFIIVKDSEQLKFSLQLETKAKNIAFNEYSLQKAQYKSYFTSKNPISINQNIIFVYKNKKIHHFTFYYNFIYYLGESNAQIEANNLNYNLKQSPFELKSVFSQFVPMKIQYCNVVKLDSETNSAQEQLQASGASSITFDSQGNMAKCDINCLSCQVGGKCKNCKSGYALKQEQCIFCNGCRACNPKNPLTCYDCYPPQLLDQASNSCVKPVCEDQNCLQCSLDKKCTFCKPGFTVESGLCKKCLIDGCLSCQSNVNQCDVDSCEEGYIYYKNPATGHSECSTCAAGCKGCLATDISSCIGCLQGFYLQKDIQSSNNAQRCKSCLQNCRQCTNKQTCNKCTAGYHLSLDKASCIKNCDQNCLTCDNNNPSKCLSCYSNSRLDTQKSICVADLSCNSIPQCSSCELGYALYHSYCYKCSYSDLNCMSCSYPSLSKCTKCITGYYLSSSSCKKCTDACQACSTLDSCSSCVQGYYLSTHGSSPTGVCLKCSSQCKSCKNTNSICTSCPNDYTLVNTKCISKNFIELGMTFNIPLQNLLSISSQVIQWLLKTANKYRAAGTPEYTKKDFILSKTISGSSVMSGFLSTQDSLGTNAVASGLSKQMSQKPTIGGVTLLGSSIKANLSSTSLSYPSNIGLILGICIPLGILVIVGIILIIIKLSNNSKQVKQGVNNRTYYKPNNGDSASRINDQKQQLQEKQDYI